MEPIIELAQRIDEEKARLRDLESAISQAYGEAGDADWSGDHELIDQAHREVAKALLPLVAAQDRLAQFIGTAEIQRAEAVR